MIWIAVIVLVIVAIIIRLSRTAHPTGNYKKAEFLSPAEKSFLHMLDTTVSSKYRIFAKVRLADIIAPLAGNASEWHSRFNRISAKHVDFLLCGSTDAQPICAIELDDKSHLANNRVQRDDFLNHSLQSAGIPIARFQAGRVYSGVEIEANIDAVLAKTPKAPNCPSCGKPMVMRTAKTGFNAGKAFWGCPGYPNCKGIVNI
jgi:ribosomal protein L37AE/L43A